MVLMAVIAIIGTLVGVLLYIDVTRDKAPVAANGQNTAQQQQPLKSIPELEAALKAEPGNLNIKLALGRAYLDANDIVKSRQQYEGVLKADPNNVVALDYMGLISERVENTKDALAYYNKGLALNPTDPLDLLYDKAALLMRLKRYEEAIPVWEKFAALPVIKGTADEQMARTNIAKAKQALAAKK